MVLDTSLLNTQQYKVRIKGKLEQSRERSSTPLHLGVVAIEKGAFGLPSTKGRQHYFYYYYWKRITIWNEYKRYSVSFFRFRFVSNVQVISNFFSLSLEVLL